MIIKFTPERLSEYFKTRDEIISQLNTSIKKMFSGKQNQNLFPDGLETYTIYSSHSWKWFCKEKHQEELYDIFQNYHINNISISKIKKYPFIKKYRYELQSLQFEDKFIIINTKDSYDIYSNYPLFIKNDGTMKIYKKGGWKYGKDGTVSLKEYTTNLGLDLPENYIDWSTEDRLMLKMVSD